MVGSVMKSDVVKLIYVSPWKVKALDPVFFNADQISKLYLIDIKILFPSIPIQYFHLHFFNTTTHRKHVTTRRYPPPGPLLQ